MVFAIRPGVLFREAMGLYPLFQPFPFGVFICEATRLECIERNREPVSVDWEQSAAAFHKAGFLVKLYFHEDKCEWLILSKFVERSIDAFQEVSEFKIEPMLAANSKDLD